MRDHNVPSLVIGASRWGGAAGLYAVITQCSTPMRAAGMTHRERHGVF